MILYNGLTLAYIGDALFELKIREYLLNKGITKVKNLHNEAIKFTQAKAQAEIAFELVNSYLSEEEISIIKRGRNQNATHKPKNADIQTYNMATGFESLIGYLYLQKNEQRLNEIIDIAMKIIEKNNENNQI